MPESSVYQHLEQTLHAELRAQIEKAHAAVQEIVSVQIEEARAAAEREYAVKNILNILEIRFQTSAVQIVKPALEKIDTIEQLNQLVPEAIQAAKLQVFIETLIRNGHVE